MQQSIGMRRVQPSIAFRVEGIVKSFNVWLNAKSKTFSALCGETFTHKEVLLAHAIVVGLMMVIGIVGALEGGAL